MTKIKTSLLAASAVAAFMAAGTAASAQGLGGSWYVKGFGGASWPQDESLDFSGDSIKDLNASGGSYKSRIDYDTGYLLGAAVGYAVTPNIAAELEYAYRNADGTQQLTISDGTTTKEFSEKGTTKSNSIMVNALYRFDPMGVGGLVQPYVGVGVGGAQLDFEGEKTDTEFAYQALGGVSYAVADNWNLYGEARWFAVNSSEVANDDGLKIDAGFETVEFLMGVSYDF